MKVIKVYPEFSDTKLLILDNPFNQIENDIINYGDQVIERPFKGMIGGLFHETLLLKSKNDDFPDINISFQSIYVGGYFERLLNNIPELTATFSIGFSLTPGFCFNFGLQKSYYKRRFGLNWELGYGGYYFSNEFYSDINKDFVLYASLFGKVGVHYLISPKFQLFSKFGLNYGNTNWHDDEEDEEFINESYGGYNISIGFTNYF